MMLKLGHCLPLEAAAFVLTGVLPRSEEAKQ